MASVIKPDNSLLNIKGSVNIDGEILVYDEATLKSKVYIDAGSPSATYAVSIY
jgi:hypothetical protein